MGDLAEITAIVKRRYETGEYGNAHFKVTPSILAEMLKHAPAPDPGSYLRGFLGGSLGNLMSIPVVVDEEMPDGAWRLVENGTGEDLHAGFVALDEDQEPERRVTTVRVPLLDAPVETP